jgi:hypothetical protein
VKLWKLVTHTLDGVRQVSVSCVVSTTPVKLWKLVTHTLDGVWPFLFQ